MPTTTTQTTAQRVQAVLIRKLAVLAADVTPQAHLTDDLGMDSLDRVDAWIALEKEFNLSIPDEVFASFTTVGDVIAYMEGRQGTDGE